MVFKFNILASMLRDNEIFDDSNKDAKRDFPTLGLLKNPFISKPCYDNKLS